MNIHDWLLWVIYPYMMLLIFIMGLIWQYDQTDWKPGLSKFKSERIASSLFKIVFSITIFTGIFAKITGTYEEITSMTSWFESLISFKPEVEWMIDRSLLFKIHALTLFAAFGIWPFTKYMKVAYLPIFLIKQWVQSFHTKPYNQMDWEDPSPNETK